MKAVIYYNADESYSVQVSYHASEIAEPIEKTTYDVMAQNDLKIKDGKKLKEALKQLMECFEIKEKIQPA